jgi:hypothetical protein
MPKPTMAHDTNARPYNTAVPCRTQIPLPQHESPLRERRSATVGRENAKQATELQAKVLRTTHLHIPSADGLLDPDSRKVQPCIHHSTYCTHSICGGPGMAAGRHWLGPSMSNLTLLQFRGKGPAGAPSRGPALKARKEGSSGRALNSENAFHRLGFSQNKQIATCTSHENCGSPAAVGSPEQGELSRSREAPVKQAWNIGKSRSNQSQARHSLERSDRPLSGEGGQSEI